MSVPDFSALHCPPRWGSPSLLEKVEIVGWNVETIGHSTSASRPQPDHHPCFDPTCGTYTVSVDGLYTIVVQLIPIGAAIVEHAGRGIRTSVDYVVRVQEPPDAGTEPDDTIESEYFDVGSVNLAQVAHLKAGTRISCIRMPASLGSECVRLKIDILQRKRKLPAPPELSKKELKKRKKMKRKAESIASSLSSGRDASSPRMYHGSAETSRVHDSSDEDEGNDSDWSNGFESDTTEDNLPHSKRGVVRLAKRFKGAASADVDS